MVDLDELVTLLRAQAHVRAVVTESPDSDWLESDAADAIEQLRAENEALRMRLDLNTPLTDAERVELGLAATEQSNG